MPSRRSVLASVSLGLAGLGGCPTLSDTDDESARTPAPRTSSPPPSAVESTATATDSEPSATEEPLGNLPEECVTDEFTGFTGTTPRPVPERPDTPTPDAAVAYAREYERYYLAYRAMYDLGPQTPDGRTGLPAHEFPDVRLAESTAEVLRSGDDRVVVRLAYDRVFEGESRGDFTVVYSVSADRTVRAETDGRVSPGPDPLDDGFVQRC
ncbi:hypothetical protein ACFQMA_07760 [Halosimplex aquaticum]|uniref:Lipoprotein n=1 Tax=Halosimplex aquaticum TaxID=3026162 RepID=A0ABD5XX77_9EURY|nr:hypothetical protein [Halosimplex aquaticum]